ncbi:MULTISPECIES: carboxypeptidase M32 [unclassified Bacillus (in: firmicutes)]|uniref:carboxypeptidase M32 n=1 Tax=unclassified Bacillus (in: firmicutes) TaxID=185979 RepID=UPI0008EF0CC5|nr:MULTISPECIES: carboxypeptidase M32 [unclassified Bacillus (in: firmicutes)]SFA87383.1 carboxypeptidase Taq [Bacillus sp. UNCCL13]SFQ84210.1 carboxypeptidase Taq [Bacillus sp. cl95]
MVAISLQKALEQFKALDEKISHFGSIGGLLDWDQKVMAPKKGRAAFAKAMGTLRTEEFKLMVSEEMGQLLAELGTEEALSTLDDVTKAQIRERKEFYDKSKSIPTDLYKEYSVLTSDANEAWESAREKNDFQVFLPYLEKIVAIKKQFAEYYGYENHPYDAMLAEYEPGLRVATLDPLFANLRESSVNLLEKIRNSGYKPAVEIFENSYAIEKQKEFNRYILPIIGFDMEAGRLDETVHPFAQTVNPGDVRITTRYLEHNVRSALFGTIHEAGHGIYEQNISADYEGTVLQTGTSFGIHESQSRFLENMVGRSLEFWKYFYPPLQKTFPEHLEAVTVEEFYRAVNAVQPSYIRVEADELTYNLHIMLRYEIEKALMAGEIEPKDLPNVWNDKMEEYLGVRPETDREGVLQDVHWSFGGIGYFPSYSLGNLYAAQILNTILKEIPDFYEQLEKGDFTKIQGWLREKIHQFGKLYSPNELIVKVTGEDLNASYLVDYLENKYSNVYNL